MKYRTNKIAIALSLALLSIGAHAELISLAKVDWSFGTTPTSISYLYSSNYVGSIYEINSSVQHNAYLGSNYSGDLSVGSSSISAQWDPLTGNSSGTLQTYTNTPLSNENWTSINTATGFRIYTDILNFSYNYHFSGSKSSQYDRQSFGVQTEIESENNGILYSDYDSSVSNFRTNWIFFSSDANLSTDEAGRRSFSVGTAGLYQNWFVRSDVLMSGSDFSGAQVNAPEPSSLILVMSGLLACFGFRRLKKQH